MSRGLERGGHHSPNKRPGLVLKPPTNESTLARFDDGEPPLQIHSQPSFAFLVPACLAGTPPPRSLSCANYFTSIVRVAVLLLPLPSSAVNVYVVVFFGEICIQRSFEGHTLASGGSSFTDFAFETP